MEDLYVDGVSNIMSGPAITKLTFYSVESITQNNAGKKNETRTKSSSVIMPTVSYLTFLKASIDYIRENREEFSSEALLSNIKNTIDDILSDKK